MDLEEKQKILASAKKWFSGSVAKNHKINTLKLTNPKQFDINPFLVTYLANFLTGNSSAESIARVLVLGRTLGTSISTSFGTNLQKFISLLKESFGSTTSGIDIEFIDQIDGHKKYCQLKLGPNTINKDDVESISGHFRGVVNLARTNGIRIPRDDMVVGVLHGEVSQLSSHYKRISKEYDYPVIIGRDLWHRLTGDENFYHDLLTVIAEVGSEADFKDEIEDVIRELAKSEIIKTLASN